MLAGLIERLKSGDDEAAESAVSELAAMGEAALPAMRALCAAEQADVRWWATRVLSELPGPTATELLLERLGDPDEAVRAAAILALGQRDDPSAVGPLVDLLPERSSYLARQASEALTRLGDPAVPALIAALAHANPQVRALAARALAHLPHPEAIPALFDVLEDNSAVVTYWADIALERRGVGQVYFKP